jgi:hypothetical protein
MVLSVLRSKLDPSLRGCLQCSGPVDSLREWRFLHPGEDGDRSLPRVGGVQEGEPQGCESAFQWRCRQHYYLPQEIAA